VDQSPRLLTDPAWPLGIYGDFDGPRNEAFIARLEADFTMTVLRLVGESNNRRASREYREQTPGVQRIQEYLRRLQPQPLIEIWKSLTLADYRDVLPDITVPTLLVHGDESHFYSVAVAEYLRASQLHPRLAQPYIDLGRIHISRNRYQDALAAYEKATVVDPQSAHAFDALGWAYFQTGNHQRAAVVLQKATEVDPTYGAAYGHLGLTNYILRNYEDAIPAYKKAIELGIDELEYYYELGLSYVYLDRCGEAIPWLEKAIESDSTAWPAWEGLDICEGE
jgi:tetratricopeptide (TPR) repeat protein